MPGNVALVTGGGRGLGRAFAVSLAEAGMRVAVAARSSAQLEETAHLIRGSGGSAIAITADVRDPAAVRAMMDRVKGALGAIDILVNNAGTGGPLGPSWQANADDWWGTFETNVRGAFLCSHAVLPDMAARGSGRIINVASGAGTRSVPYMSAYVASKAALIRFSETLAQELQPHGVTVFSIQPGTVRTALVEEILGSEEAKRWLPWFVRIMDEGQDVTPDSAVRLLRYLASGKADELSGRFFMVPEHPEEVVSRAEEVKRDRLYMLEMRTLTR